MDAPPYSDPRIDLQGAPDAPLPLAAILAQVHGELTDLGRSADDLQAVISGIAAASEPPLARDDQMRLQAADAHSQRLARLAQLAHALQGATPAGWRLDAPGGSELARGLARLAETRSAAREGPTEDAGECELF